MLVPTRDSKIIKNQMFKPGFGRPSRENTPLVYMAPAPVYAQ